MSKWSRTLNDEKVDVIEAVERVQDELLAHLAKQYGDTAVIKYESEPGHFVERRLVLKGM